MIFFSCLFESFSKGWEALDEATEYVWWRLLKLASDWLCVQSTSISTGWAQIFLFSQTWPFNFLRCWPKNGSFDGARAIIRFPLRLAFTHLAILKLKAALSRENREFQCHTLNSPKSPQNYSFRWLKHFGLASRSLVNKTDTFFIRKTHKWQI